MLISVARRLQQMVRDNDTVARLGGDEFAIIQTGINRPDDAAVLATRVLTQFTRPLQLPGVQLTIGISIGIAIAPDDAGTIDALLAKADAALYRSKGAGRGQFRFSSDVT